MTKLKATTSTGIIERQGTNIKNTEEIDGRFKIN